MSLLRSQNLFPSHVLPAFPAGLPQEGNPLLHSPPGYLQLSLSVKDSTNHIDLMFNQKTLVLGSWWIF